jgi:hypothetical protein
MDAQDLKSDILIENIHMNAHPDELEEKLANVLHSAPLARKGEPLLNFDLKVCSARLALAYSERRFAGPSQYQEPRSRLELALRLRLSHFTWSRKSFGVYAALRHRRSNPRGA